MEPDFRAATGISVQKLTVHNRKSSGWTSPPDLMFLKGFTQQAPAAFLDKSVMSRRDLTSLLPTTYICTQILYVCMELHIHDRNRS